MRDEGRIFRSRSHHQRWKDSMCFQKKTTKICGPGGHAKDGSTPKKQPLEVKLKVAMNIVPLSSTVGEYKGSSGQHMPSGYATINSHRSLERRKRTALK